MKTKERKPRGYWDKILTKQFFEDQYALNKINAQIIKETGCSYATLNQYKKIHGFSIAVSDWSKILTKEFLLSQHKLGKTDVQIAKEIGCSDKTLGHYRNLYSIPSNKLKTMAKIGEKYNKLTVIKKAPNNKYNKTCFLCQCECGQQTIVQNSNLVFDRIRSCGCLSKFYGNKHKCWRGYGDISISLFNKIKTTLKRKTKTLSFDITIQEAWELFLRQDKKCQLSGLDIYFPKKHGGEFTASLDRIDSNLGYISGNIQWVYKDINKMKWDFGQDYFIQTCGLIANNFEKPFDIYKQDKIYNSKLYLSYRKSILSRANKTNLKNNITQQYLENLFEQQCGRCYLSKQPLVLAKDSKEYRYSQTASLDRINSNLWYIEGNVAWCHKHVNLIKRDYNLEYFISLCKLINKHNE